MVIFFLGLVLAFSLILSVHSPTAEWFKNPKHKEFTIVVLIAAIVLFGTNMLHGGSSNYLKGTCCDNYTYLAWGWLHGQYWVQDWPGTQIDAVLFNGKRIIIEAPFPGLVVLPWVFFWGLDSLTEVVPSLLTGVAITGIYWLIFNYLGLKRRDRLILTLFTFIGTDVMWCAHLGDVWFFSPVVAFACTGIALLECTGKRRGWIIGLAALCAFESRSTLAPAFLLYPYLIISGALSLHLKSMEDKIKSLRSYFIILAIGLVVWIFYNEIRWGTIGDIGYQVWCNQDSMCNTYDSPFGFEYLAYEIYMFFFRGPDVIKTGSLANIFQFPWFNQNTDGLALTFSSPALIIAFWARRNWTVIMFWVVSTLIFIPELLYYVDGFSQVGMRHMLDVEPFLIILMALAIKTYRYKWFYILMGYSALVGIWSCWTWDFLNRF